MFDRKKAPRRTDMTLNISSLMDILTILLLFLILSFGNQDQDLTPPEGFDLPDSDSQMQVHMAVKVSVSDEGVLVEEIEVAKFQNARVRRQDLDANKLIKPLLRELQRKKAEVSKGSQIAGKDDESVIVYLEADKGTRFTLLDRVLKTAASAGFTKFRLAVHRGS